MTDISFRDIAIVSCGTLTLELSHLRAEGFLDTEHLFFTTPGLHEDIHELERQLLARIAKARWPGNIRELENVIERAVINTSGPKLRLAEDLSVPAGNKMSPTLKSLQEIEKDHIQEVLQFTKWRIEGAKGAAQILAMNPSTLRSRIRKLGIQKP